jgi:hypothetical protein
MYIIGRNVNVVLTGRTLAHHLENLNKAQRAISVANWRAHDAVLVDLSLAQWGTLVGVNPGYISKASQLTSKEQTAVYDGTRSLIETNGNGYPIDLDEVIATFGAETVAARALDALPAKVTT